ncbi:MAG: lysophospholipid acyltransferase family protein [Blastocatellia bacterium]
MVFRIRFEGVENVPKTGACIITPNHATYLDPILMTIPIHRRIHYMTWSKVFEIPVIGSLARLFGAFPVRIDTVDAAAQREASDLLENGKVLMMYPEGGRTINGRLMPFKLGAFRLALTHGTALVPVAIEGAYKVWPAGKLLPRPGRVKITYLPPIEVAKLEAATKVELRERARLLASEVKHQIAGVLGESLEDPQESATPTAAAN